MVKNNVLPEKKKKACKCDVHYTCKACRTRNTYTYDEIGEALGISHQAVWEIERRALRKAENLFKLLGYNSIEEVL